ncbi:hypothetical protein Btru_031846 [Bulinus truncatus]|nr:hypothetical protein Btru_031846 [Bulinus truncatus]
MSSPYILSFCESLVLTFSVTLSLVSPYIFSDSLGIKCPEPEPPENGFIVGKGTRVGSVLYVHCHEGYRLDGPTVMACVPTSETAQWDPKVRRVCVEGGSYFNEDPSKSDMTESSPQGAPLKHAENRPMEHGFPSFIGPKAHSSWAKHHNKPEHEQEEEARMCRLQHDTGEIKDVPIPAFFHNQYVKSVEKLERSA